MKNIGIIFGLVWLGALSASAQIGLPVTGTLDGLAPGAYQMEVAICGNGGGDNCEDASIQFCEIHQGVQVGFDGFFSFFIGDGITGTCGASNQPLQIPRNNPSLFIKVEALTFGPFKVGSSAAFAGRVRQDFAVDKNRIYLEPTGAVEADTTNFQNALIRLSGATQQDPKTLELGAGTFRLRDDGAASIVVPRFVSLVGQGQQVTIIRAEDGLEFSAGRLGELTLIAVNNVVMDTLLTISCNGSPIVVSNLNVQSGALISDDIIKIDGPCTLTNDQVSLSGIRVNHQANTPGVVGIAVENAFSPSGVPNFRISDVFIRVQVDGNGASVSLFDIDAGNANVVLSNVQALGAPGTVAVNHESSTGLRINGLHQRQFGGAAVTGQGNFVLFGSSVFPSPTNDSKCVGSINLATGLEMPFNCQ